MTSEPDLPLFAAQAAPPAKKPPAARCPDCGRPAEGKAGSRCEGRGDETCRSWVEWRATERMRLRAMLGEAERES